MSSMFLLCSNVNPSTLGAWDVRSVTEASFMFRGATSFNIDISSWDLENVKLMDGMFKGTYLRSRRYAHFQTNIMSNRVRFQMPFCSTRTCVLGESELVVVITTTFLSMSQLCLKHQGVSVKIRLTRPTFPLVHGVRFAM